MASAVRPRFVPPPFQDAAEQGRLILRNGSTATIRLARPEDAEALRVFFDGLSPESRRRRFFSVGPPLPELITSLSDSSDPRSALTLLVIRTAEGGPRIVATGSYFAKDERTAEVAFAVDESFQGKGLGTLLLERLAVLAVRNGFTRFWAITHADNRAMRDVFRESGFALAEELRGSEIEVDLSVVPSETAVARLETRDRIATAASLRPFFRPRSVAVVGASRDPASIGYRILEALVGSRFQGPVYPVNPNATVVSCIRAYPSVRNLPEPVDLAVIAVPRDAVLGVVDECAARGVRALVVITRRLCRSECRGPRTPEEIGREGPRPRHALDRPELPRAAQHGPGRSAERLVFAVVSAAGPGRDVESERRPRSRRPCRCEANGPGSVHVRQRREQSRRVRQRPVAILGRRPGDRRDPSLPGVVRQPAAIRADRPAGESAEAGRSDQDRSDAGRGTGRRDRTRPPSPQKRSPSTPCSGSPGSFGRTRWRRCSTSRRPSAASRCRAAGGSASSRTRADRRSCVPTPARSRAWCCRSSQPKRRRGCGPSCRRRRARGLWRPSRRHQCRR
jgi:RimJ/RimL family protein N-acetyltransferase